MMGRLTALMVVVMLVVSMCWGASDATTIRAAAELTTADVLATTVTQSSDEVRDIELFADYTSETLTNLTVTITAKKTDKAQPGLTDWYTDDRTSFTMTNTAKNVFVFPASQFQTAEPVRFAAKGTGTVTSSSLVLRYRFRSP